MSNSWKRYGSNKVYDKGRIFRTENVITERFTFQGDFDGNSQTTEASTLDLFFADAGNVDSTTLLDRIRWES